MGYEIDYLAVGAGEKSGDAIAIRYGNLLGARSEQTVMVIDGGTKESGQDLVNHIRTHFQTEIIDMAWCSHADGDHASGLTVLIEQMQVNQLLMHQPWNHASDIRDLFHDGRITDNSLDIRIRASLQAAHDLEQTAIKYGVPIVEPFQGDATRDGSIVVLGPSKDYYQQLIPLYRGTPDPIRVFADLLQKATYATKEAIKWVSETLDIRTETLVDPTGSNGTSPENNSSTILLLTVGTAKMLFTGDAGMPALEHALNYATARGISMTDLTLLHVPHHGSKRNVGPTVLNRISAKNAYISAAAGGAPKHPSKKVVNALIRRGSDVHITQGEGRCRTDGAPPRAGWYPVSPASFQSQVEE